MNVYIWEPVVISDMQWPCNDGFHVPLKSEWEWVISIWNALWLWSTAWTNFSTYLKLPFTWFRAYNSTNLTNQWAYWYYRSSEQRSSDNRAYWLFVWPSWADSIVIWSFYKGWGSCIRSFKNTFVVPTSWWTVIAWTLGSWGIFWNQSEWLISITSDWSTGYTIKDKNEWATTVWNSWDTLSQNNCWYYYQWGNNYWFAFTWTISDTSTTKIDASTYWPWNYYSSNIWIKQDEWDLSNNDNLRWWVSQWSSQWTAMSELKNAYIGEYKGWTPWANTLAYYPLKEDVLDYSGNNRNWTNYWVTFSNWLWVFNGSSYVSLWTWSWTNIQTNMTISAWFKWNWSWSKDNMVVAKSQYYAPWTWYSNYAFYVISIHEEDRYLMAWFYNQSDFNAHPLNFRTTWWWSPTLWPVTQSNKWYHIVITNDWTTKKAYINWTLVATETNTSTSSTQSVETRIWSAVRYNYDSYFNWNISAVIFEDKTWSAQEVADYYNQTKSNYWL